MGKVLNVVRGGIAIPLGRNNLYYMSGRKHINGGIDIGKNPRTGLEVEGGEVVQTSDKGIKVFSSLPFLNGESPASKVMKGNNANKVFKQQESFKDRNKINDDGTRKAKTGGRWRSSNSIRNRIARWEGSSMKTNNSFENEDAGFINAIPASTRNKMSQGELDALYSYSYNVGSGNFKKRVVPSLVRLYNGTGSVEEVQRNMYGKRDRELKGLQTRRATERKLFANAYNFKNKKGKNLVDEAVKKITTAAPDATRVAKPQPVAVADNTAEQIKNLQGSIDEIKDAMTAQANTNDIYNNYLFAKAGDILENGSSIKYNSVLKMGGLSRSKDYGSKSKPYPSVSKGDFAGGGRSYPIPTKADAIDALRLAGLHGRSDVKAKVYAKYPGLRKKAKAGGYILNIGGKDKLLQYPHPSTGEIKKNTTTKTYIRAKAPNGGKINTKGIWVYDTLAKERKKGIVKEKRTKDTIDAMPEIVVTSSRRNSSNKSTSNVKNPVKGTLSSTTTNKGNKSFNISYEQTPWGQLAKEQNETAKEYIPNTFVRKSQDQIDYEKRTADIPEYIRRPYEDKNWKIGDSNTPKPDNWLTKAGNYLKENYTVGDAIGLGSNVLGSIASNIINRNMLNSLQYKNAPVPYRSAKLKTRININPQIDRMNENLANYENYINNNTGSSQVALSRIQKARANRLNDLNTLYGNKENAETELINKDRLNQQQVANQNIENYNNWSEGKTAFENDIANQKALNNIGLIQNLNTAVQDTLTRGENRAMENKTIGAMMAANPNLPIETFEKLGIVNPRYARWYTENVRRNNHKTNMKL